MPTFATLLLGHLLGDFPLQTDQIYRWKKEGNVGIAIHVAVHLIITIFLLGNPLQAWLVLLLLGMIHFGIDWLKAHIPARRQTPGFILDQLAHGVSLLGLTWWQPHLQPRLSLEVIYLAVLGAILPAVIMLIWVIVGDLEAGQAAYSHARFRLALLRGSQLLGLLIIIGIVLAGGTTFLADIKWSFGLPIVVLAH